MSRILVTRIKLNYSVHQNNFAQPPLTTVCTDPSQSPYTHCTQLLVIMGGTLRYSRQPRLTCRAVSLGPQGTWVRDRACPAAYYSIMIVNPG